MKNRFLRVDADDYRYLTGEKVYTWPITDCYINLKFHADDTVTLYLVSSVEKDAFVPLASSLSFSGQYNTQGFDTLMLTCSPRTRIAIQVNAATAAELDPVDYTPVPIDPPASRTEEQMMNIMLHKRLSAMGVQPQVTDGDGTPEDDLEFFEDDGDLPDTLFTYQPEGDLSPETPQPAVTPPSETPETGENPPNNEPSTEAPDP